MLSCGSQKYFTHLGMESTHHASVCHLANLEECCNLAILAIPSQYHSNPLTILSITAIVLPPPKKSNKIDFITIPRFLYRRKWPLQGREFFFLALLGFLCKLLIVKRQSYSSFLTFRSKHSWFVKRIALSPLSDAHYSAYHFIRTSFTAAFLLGLICPMSEAHSSFPS